MSSLRNELLLLRDGTPEETEVRSAKIAALGLALEGAPERRGFRGREADVKAAAAGLLRHAASRAADGCWSGADAHFWRAHARAQFAAWKQGGATGRPELLAAALEGWRRVEAAGDALTTGDLAEKGEATLFAGDFGEAAATLGRLVEATSGAAGDGGARRTVVLRVAMLYEHALNQHAQSVALVYRLAAAGGVTFGRAGSFL